MNDFNSIKLKYFLYSAGTAAYILLLYFFYKKYVPLMASFQAVMIPLVFIVFIIAAFDVKKGLYVFIFFFPLVNSLPYFFNISDSIPHAPAALVLFLFFFLGWGINIIFISKRKIKKDFSIFKPVWLSALLVTVSGLITLFRFMNFPPFLSDSFYELKTNVIGVTAGGAVMSTVFFSLSYLTAFAFFFVVVNTLKEKKEIINAVSILCVSAFVSFCVGLLQYSGKMNLGINPRLLRAGHINSTFKDALSLGAFIAVVLGLFLAMFFYERKIKKVFYFILIGLSLFMLLLTGSRSGFLCVLASIFIFMILASWWRIKVSGKRLFSFRNITVFMLIGVLAAFSVFFISQMDTQKGSSERFSTLKRLGISGERGLFSYLIYSRNHLWKSGILMMKDYPLTGVGMGAYIIELANYAHKHGISIKTPESAENYFIQIGAELGIIGLFLFLWIIWEILKRIKRQYSGIKDKSRVNFLIIGMICGIAVYLINIQAHTYIGSYEVKYTFWLLTGLLFCLSRVEGNSEKYEKRTGFGRKYKAFGAVLIILYGGGHLWNSAHSLSLAARTEAFGIKQEFGFYPWEETEEGRKFRWMGGSGGMTLEMKMPEMTISLLASHPEIQSKPVRVKIYLVKNFFREKILLDELNLNQNLWKTYTYSLPEEAGNEIFLLFKVSRTWNPLKRKGIADPRNLGVAVGPIRFKE